MGLNYYPRPVRADLDPPNDFITESMANNYGDDVDLAHWADGHYTMEFVDRQLDVVERKVRNLFADN